MPRTVLKVCGGGGGGGLWVVLRPILVFSLILDQAEQFQTLKAEEKKLILLSIATELIYF